MLLFNQQRLNEDDYMGRTARTLGLIFCAYLGVAYSTTRWAGEHIEEYGLLVPQMVHTLPLVSHATNLALSFVSCSYETDGLKFRHALIWAHISACCVVGYGLMRNPATVLVFKDAFGQLFLPLRYVKWCFTTPFMLVMLGSLANIPRKQVYIAVALDEGMLICGMFAHTPNFAFSVLMMLFSCALFVPLMHTIWQFFSKALERSKPGSKQEATTFACRNFTMLVWCAFPVCDLVRCFNLIPLVYTEACWSVLDFSAKTVFVSLLLHSNYVSVDHANLMESAAEAKAAQLAALCHELRNPLNGVFGNLQELELAQTRQEDLASQTEFLSYALTCCQHMRRILDDFLDISKIEKGLLRLSNVRVRVRAVVTEVCKQILRAAEEKGLAVEMEVESTLDHMLFTLDSHRVQQVLANFAWNSVKFSTVGSITFRVRSSLVDGRPDKRMLYFDVQDTGCGMDPQQQQRIFEPYTMGNPSRIGKYGGSGLGLNICKTLAELMGGKVSCRSVPGMGSVFTLQLECEWGEERNYSDDTMPTLSSGGQVRTVMNRQRASIDVRRTSIDALRPGRSWEKKAGGDSSLIGSRPSDGSIPEIPPVPVPRSQRLASNSGSVRQRMGASPHSSQEKRLSQSADAQLPQPLLYPVPSLPYIPPVPPGHYYAAPSPAPQYSHLAPHTGPGGSLAPPLYHPYASQPRLGLTPRPVRAAHLARSRLKSWAADLREKGVDFSMEVLNVERGVDEVTVLVQFKVAHGVYQVWGGAALHTCTMLADCLNDAVFQALEQAAGLLFPEQCRAAEAEAAHAAALALAAPMSAQALEGKAHDENGSLDQLRRELEQKLPNRPRTSNASGGVGASDLMSSARVSAVVADVRMNSTTDAATAAAAAASVAAAAAGALTVGAAAAGGAGAGRHSQPTAAKRPSGRASMDLGSGADELTRTTSLSSAPARAGEGDWHATTGPAAAQSAPSLPNLARMSSADGPPPAPLHILVVDDVPTNVRLLQKCLARAPGVTVDTGEDGQDMVDLIINQGKQYDIVLLDEHMRKMNGSQATSLTRKYEVAQKIHPVLIVAVTGNALAEDRLRFCACGFDAVIIKPVKLRSLLDNLRTLLQMREDESDVLDTAAPAWATGECSQAMAQRRLQQVRQVDDIVLFGYGV